MSRVFHCEQHVFYQDGCTQCVAARTEWLERHERAQAEHRQDAIEKTELYPIRFLNGRRIA